MNEINLPPLPEPDDGPNYHTSGVLMYNDTTLQAYARAAIEANTQAVPDVLHVEAKQLADILSGMVNGGYSDLETLYTEDQADGDAFVKRAAEVLALLAASPQPAPQPVQPIHPDDMAVDRFAAFMKAKLAIARNKGRGGWEECSQTELSRMLREHVEKGDPRDVANFAMFLWSLGYGIVAQAPQPERVPLTDEQIDEGIAKLAPQGTRYWRTEVLAFRDGVRFAETAHNIKKG